MAVYTMTGGPGNRRVVRDAEMMAVKPGVEGAGGAGGGFYGSRAERVVGMLPQEVPLAVPKVEALGLEMIGPVGVAASPSPSGSGQREAPAPASVPAPAQGPVSGGVGQSRAAVMAPGAEWKPEPAVALLPGPEFAPEPMPLRWPGPEFAPEWPTEPDEGMRSFAVSNAGGSSLLPAARSGSGVSFPVAGPVSTGAPGSAVAGDPALENREATFVTPGGPAAPGNGMQAGRLPAVEPGKEAVPLWQGLTTLGEEGEVVDRFMNGDWRVRTGPEKRERVFRDVQVASMTGMRRGELESFIRQHGLEREKLPEKVLPEKVAYRGARSAPHLAGKLTPEQFREVAAAQAAEASKPRLEWRQEPVYGQETPEDRLTVRGEWKVEDLQNFLQSPHLERATPAQRMQALNEVLEQAGRDFMSRPDFNQTDYSNYRDLARQMREEMESRSDWLDTANSGADMVLDVGRGAVRTGFAIGADGTIFEPDAAFAGEGESVLRAPFGNVAQQAGHWMDKLGDSTSRVLAWSADEELESTLAELRKDMEEGNIPAGDRAAYDAWLGRYGERLSGAQARWYKGVQGADKKITLNGKEETMDEDWLQSYALVNGLEAPQNMALVSGYLRTQNPALLDQLRENLKRTPQREDIDRRQRQSLDDSSVVNFLTQNMGGGDYSEVMMQAGNPLELASHLLPYVRGLRMAAQAGRSTGQALRSVAGSLVANAGMEAVNMHVENPEATLAQYRAAGRDMVATALGMHVLGYGHGKASQAADRAFDRMTEAVTSRMDEKTAAMRRATAQQKAYHDEGNVPRRLPIENNDAHSKSEFGTPPSFLRISQSNVQSDYDRRRNERPYREREDRNPRRALEIFRQGTSGGRSGDTEEAVGRAYWPESRTSGYRLPSLAERDLLSGLESLTSKSGTEHDVYFDPRSSAAIKLTKAGEVGAQRGGLEGYLERLAWTNEIFGDAIRVEGIVQLPGEAASRVVTTQPWYKANGSRPEPSQKEIDIYMRKMGFLKAYDGAYLHETKSLAASDAVPKNFIRTEDGHVHPVDVILFEPNGTMHERLQNMANNHPQVELPRIE